MWGYDRPISTPRLKPLRALHLAPINVVISHGPHRYLILGWASHLDAFSAYPDEGAFSLARKAPASKSGRSYPAVLLAEELVHQRSVHPGPLVTFSTLAGGADYIFTQFQFSKLKWGRRIMGPTYVAPIFIGQLGRIQSLRGQIQLSMSSRLLFFFRAT